MKLVLTIDVEEEGLFQNQYTADDTPLTNIPNLQFLDTIFATWSIKPTLLVTYQAARHRPCFDLIKRLTEKWGGEIGAHLHHWNTPPFQDLPHKDPVPSELIPRPLLQAKLDSLLQVIRQGGIEPKAFRMGRFNLGPKMFSLLLEAGFKVDASICPLRWSYGGPDHLNAPLDPYHPDPLDPVKSGQAPLLEIPLTIFPFHKHLGRLVGYAGRRQPRLKQPLAWLTQYLGSIPVQPVAVGLRRLKTAVQGHRRRGGRVVTSYFHSSELLPGGCPQHQTADDVRRFLDRLDRFCAWMTERIGAESLTMSDLADRRRARDREG